MWKTFRARKMAFFTVSLYIHFQWQLQVERFPLISNPTHLFLYNCVRGRLFKIRGGREGAMACEHLSSFFTQPDVFCICILDCEYSFASCLVSQLFIFSSYKAKLFIFKILLRKPSAKWLSLKNFFLQQI